jgi:hypothetical protein
MTDRQLMEQALRALNMLTADEPKDKMPFSEIMLLMVALRERLEKNDQRQLMWAQQQAEQWKTHARDLMKKLQDKDNV